MKRALLYVGSWVAGIAVATVFAVALGFLIVNAVAFGRLVP